MAVPQFETAAETTRQIVDYTEESRRRWGLRERSPRAGSGDEESNGPERRRAVRSGVIPEGRRFVPDRSRFVIVGPPNRISDAAIRKFERRKGCESDERRPAS
jgi:hypothetical protein